MKKGLLRNRVTESYGIILPRYGARYGGVSVLAAPGKASPVQNPPGMASRSRSPKAAAQREDLFVAAYVATGFNAEEAAVQAGFSPATAASHGKEMVRRLRHRIDAAVRAKEAALQLKGDEVLADLAASFRVDRRGYFRKDGTLKPPGELTREQAMLLDGFDVDEVSVGGEEKGGKTKVTVRTTKVRLEKHLATREQAMRHLGLFPREQGPVDPDEAARMVRERLGDIHNLAAQRQKEK